MRILSLAASALILFGLLAIAGSAADPAAKPAIDPVKANGAIFVGWPKPEFALVISGELDGYLEPCGCAGLENQMGGLKRRETLLQDLKAKGWPLVSLDMGGLVKRRGLQTEIKYRYAVKSLADLGYACIGLGAAELALDNIDAVADALINLDPASNPVISANVGVYGLQESVDLGLTKRFRVIEAGGKRIGVTSVLGAKYQEALKNREELGIISAAEGLAQVAPLLDAEKCDVQVLMVHGDPQEAEALALKFPQFQIVATTGGAEEPPQAPKAIPGSKSLLVEAGHKGMYVAVLGFFNDPQQPVRYQRVPLDARFAEGAAMKKKLTEYQKELETVSLEFLVKKVAHPDGEFAGSAACADCHTAAWEVFEKTPHAHATDTLVKLDPPRHFDPECLSCHVTGWNPQEYFPYATGYAGLTETPEMLQNGCENCHGPAADHVRVENGEVNATDQEKEALRAALRMNIVANEGNKDGQVFEEGQVVKNCMRCHDIDNSPDFDFQKYWPSVKHEGKE
jgi:hypothetical protein